MRRLMPAPALPALLAALICAPPLGAQERPSDPRDATAAPSAPAATPAPPAPTPAPAATPAPPAPTPAPVPAPPKSTVPMAPLGASLDFARWQGMTPRERQTFVEGAILALGSVASSLRAELLIDNRTPPAVQAAVVKFVDANYPKRPAAAYQKEMESIYLTAEGQKLPINECFLQAFRRVNGR